MRIFLSLLFLMIPLMHGQECPPVKQHQRDIVLLPDTASDELVQAFGYQLANKSQISRLEKLLTSQSTPILVELTIWKRFSKKVKDAKETSLQKLPYFYYQISNYLLCVPKAWQERYPDTGFNVEINTIKKVSNPFLLLPGFLDPVIGFGKTNLMLVNIYGSIVKALRTLLVHPTTKSYNWNVLLFGHGGPVAGGYTDRVAGLPSTEFKNLLRFLNSEISTNSFLYQTCYAGSKWLLKSYETGSKPDSYNYVIILTGITESPVYSWSNHLIMVYQQFFEKIRTISICPQQSQELFTVASMLLQAITLQEDGKTYSLRRINNILQIRWPNTTKFNIVEIDSIITTAKSVKKSSDETATITSEAFVLNTPYLDKPIIFGPGDHAIASSINKKDHYIKDLTISETFDSAQELSERLLEFFVQVKNLSLLSSKRYMIDTVSNNEKKETITSVIIFVNSPTPSTLPLIPTTLMFYLHNQKGYILDAKKLTTQELSPALTKAYLSLFNREKNNLIPTQKK